MKDLNIVKMYIEAGDLKNAINEIQPFLGEHPSGDEAILLSGRLERLRRAMQRGTIDWQNQQTESNRISEALLQIVRELEKTDAYIKYTKTNRIVSIIRIVYDVSNKILIQNQQTLSPVFRSQFNRTLVSDAVGDLYHNQQERGNFGIWSTILLKESQNSTIEEETRLLLLKLVECLKAFTDALYSRKMVLNKQLVWGKLKLPTVPVEEIKEIVGDYLEFLRERVEIIGSIVAQIEAQFT